jgi:DNA-binding transcriptional regulator YiaG
VTPTPEQVKASRAAAGLTQRAAAAHVGSMWRTWQDWELGKRNMPSAKWELWLIKTKQPPPPE